MNKDMMELYVQVKNFTSHDFTKLFDNIYQFCTYTKIKKLGLYVTQPNFSNDK